MSFYFLLLNWMATEKGELTFDNVPTVELHRHWEAGMSPETIAIIAERNGIEELKTVEGMVLEGVYPQNPESVRKYAQSIVDGFKGSNGFANFLSAFRALSSVLRTEGDLELAIFEQLREEQAAGSIHTELRGSPISLIRPLGGVPLKDIILAMRRGVDRAYRDLGMSGTLIACFSREKGIGDPNDIVRNQAVSLIQTLLRIYDTARPIGLDIAGTPEIKFPPQIFERVMAPAGEAGIPLTIHAGEQCKPPNFAGAPVSFINDAIWKLNARRIGHGVSLMDNSAEGLEVMAWVKMLRVGVEACPVSNEMMGIIELKSHPLRQFLDEGLLVSAGTDDPLFFGVASVRDMIGKNAAALLLTPSDALKLTRNAIETAFVTEERREELREKLWGGSEGSGGGGGYGSAE